jgi:hypothetical protein
MSQESPPTTEAKPAAQPQAPPSPPPMMGDWFAPPGSMQHREPSEILGEVHLEAMKPMMPSMDVGEAVARSMEPHSDMTPHLEGPMLDVGDQQHPTTPMFRRGPAQGYNGMVCPLGSIGNCIYCSSLPCLALKAKVLEVVAMEYKVLAGQPAQRIK